MCSISSKKHLHVLCVGVNENRVEQLAAVLSCGRAIICSLFSNILVLKHATTACSYFILILGKCLSLYLLTFTLDPCPLLRASHSSAWPVGTASWPHLTHLCQFLHPLHSRSISMKTDYKNITISNSVWLLDSTSCVLEPCPGYISVPSLCIKSYMQ